MEEGRLILSAAASSIVLQVYLSSGKLPGFVATWQEIHCNLLLECIALVSLAYAPCCMRERIAC